MSQTEILNPQQLANECELTLGRIHQLIRAGTIRATQLGGIYVITREEADRFKAERERQAKLDWRIKTPASATNVPAETPKLTLAKHETPIAAPQRPTSHWLKDRNHQSSQPRWRTNGGSK